MKLTFLLVLSVLLTSCSSKEARLLSDYEAINEVWERNGTIKDLEKYFGNPSIIEKQKAEYTFPNSKVPKMHFQFTKEGKLEIALLFLEQDKLDGFKSFIGCQWIEKAGKKETSDFIDQTHEGQCKNKPISFSYFSSLNSYQVWWNKK
jgi:hypothetical protein